MMKYISIALLLFCIKQGFCALTEYHKTEKSTSPTYTSALPATSKHGKKPSPAVATELQASSMKYFFSATSTAAVSAAITSPYSTTTTTTTTTTTPLQTPGPVPFLNFSRVLGDYSVLVLHFTCFDPAEKHGHVTHYVIKYTADNDISESTCGMSKLIQNITGLLVEDDGSCNFTRNVPVTPNRHYTFTIQAFSNFPGRISSFEILTQNGPPGPVSNLKRIKVTNTSVDVEWATPEHVNGMIYSYQFTVESVGRCRVCHYIGCGDFNNLETVSWKKKEKECTCTEAKTPKISKITHNGDLHSITVTDLLSYTHYTIHVVAINSAGPSKDSNVTIMTSIGVPGEPTNFRATVNSSSTITLFWSPSVHQAGPTSFIIDVSGEVDQRTNNCHDNLSLQVKGYSTSSTFVIKLCSYTNYTLTIMASTAAGHSSCVTLNKPVRTGTEAADPPQSVKVENVTPTSVRLSWMPSIHQCGLTDYIVHVKEQSHLQSEDYVLNRTITVHGFHNNTADIASLTSYWKYRFSVLAKTSVHPDSSPVIAEIQTLQSQPGNVENLTVTPINGNYTAVTVSFSSPKNPNGAITHYMLSYFIQSPGHTNPACEALKQITNNTGILIQAQLNYTALYSAIVKVSPETTYSFQVTAYNSLNGIPAETNYTTGNNVSGPIQDLQINNKTSDSVLVTWNPPSQPNGFLTGYRLQIKIVQPDIDDDCYIAAELSCKGEKIRDVSRKSWKAGKKCGTTPTITYFKHNGGLYNVTIADLLSYTFYNVSVVPINTKGSGPSDDTSFMTDIGVPDEPNDFHAITKSSSTIILFWSPSEHQAGPTNYSIVVDGNVDHRTNNCIGVEVINVTGYNTSSEVVANLCSYTYYNFTIIASTKAGSSSRVPTNQTVRTGTGIPTAPRNLFATSVSPSIVNISWTPSEHKAGKTSYLIEVKGELDQVSDIFTNITSQTVKGFSNTTLVVQDLLSYTNYEFVIRARTTAGESNATDTAVRTQPKAADPPRSLRVENVTPTSVKLSWMPSKHLCGLTDYIVDVEEQPYLRADFYIPNRTITVHGFHNNTVSVGNMISYWKYRISVRARTIYPDSSSVFAEIQTLESPPGRVGKIQVSALPDNYTAVNLTWECPEERERHGPISSFTVQYSDKKFTFDHFPDGYPCRKPQIELHSAVLPVHPEKTYEFTVFASAKYEGRKTVSVSFCAKAGKPPKENSTKIFLITPSVTSETTTESTFPVTVNTDLLRDSTNGRIVMIGLLVMKDTAIVDVPENFTLISLMNWRGWKEWKKDYKGTYRPTPDNWLIPQIRRKRSTDSASNSTTRFIVGNDNCESKEHCNGPVEADTTYRVIAVSCTNVGCSSSTPFGPFRTKAKSVAAAAVGGVLAALVVVGIVIGGLVYRRQRNRKRHHHGDDPNKQEEVESVNKTRPKKLSDFSPLVDEYHKDSERLFAEEWREIGLYSPSHPYENATLEVNREKNRYTNILAYDQTRVKLLPKTEDDGSDYINANFILGFSRPREYIASQGPVPGTLEDFWQMIWEQNVPIIVQLTDLYEGGRRKLSRYWPEEVNVPETFGEVQVETVSLSPMNKYTIKVFNVSVGSKSRQVKHFFLQGWQDYNANLKTGDVIDFARYVRNELKPTDKGPMVVHCSAGVGRTGTFICVDYFLQVIDKADLEDSIDIFSFVLKMRDCRPLMVQSESQYVFVHDAVKEMIERKKKALAGVDEVLYENQAFDPEDDEEDNIYENT